MRIKRIINLLKRFKHFNKNSIVFIFFIAFTLYGLKGDSFTLLKTSTFDFITELKKGNFQSLFTYQEQLEKSTSVNLSYHDKLMFIDSVKSNLLGIRVVDKGETLVVKTYDDSLVGYFKEKYDDAEVQNNVNYIYDIWKQVQKNGAHFLYCIHPDKVCYGNIPSNVIYHNNENYDNLIKKLNSKNIPYLNYMDSFENMHLSRDDIFFNTDHHWKPEIGLLATQILCTELSSRFNVNFEQKYFDLKNYNSQILRNYFLGSYGKKVGIYFTWKGADDFSIITPRFETNLTESRPQQNIERSGKFEDTVLFSEHLNKGLYIDNNYATYSGGDFRLQIIKNNLNTNGTKVLLIRDSFSCVVSPFLALQTKELHIIDDRVGSYPEGEMIDIHQYIKDGNFDYVIMIK